MAVKLLLSTFVRRALASLAVLFAVAAAAAVPAAHLQPPAGLRCNGAAQPLAVADAHPAFSWQLAAAARSLHGVAQSAYRIQAAATERDLLSGKNLLWDSGQVHASTASGIVYAGAELTSGRAYVWRVRVWDEGNRSTGWSRTARWTQAPVWRASWIAAHAEDTPSDDEPLPLFRKQFALGKPVARAYLYASGLGQDELRMNGRKVGDDLLTPGWSEYRKTVYYDAYDVTALLRPGANTVGVLLGNGMYRVLKTPHRYIKFAASYGPPKLSAQLHIEFADGTSTEIFSDESWRTAPGPITFSSTYGGEDFDARREPAGWDRPGFSDADWRPATVVPGPGGQLTPEIAPPIRALHTYTPVKIAHPRPGVTVYDLGQNFAGWPQIAVSGPAGATVKLISGELLDKDGLVSQRSAGSPQWFAYTLRGAGTETWHPRFSYYGFRYVQVEGDAQMVRLEGTAVHSSSEPIGDFAASNDLLNRIHTLILRAVENNAVSLFTDCPHREKLGWLEETHLLASALFYDFDFAGLYAATARNIADTQRSGGPKDGMVPEIAPQYVVFPPVSNGIFNDSPEWGSAAVLSPWYAYQRTGDLRFLAAQYDVMRRYTAYLGTRASNGIIAYGLGDWFDVGHGAPGVSQLTTPGVTATAIYIQDLQVLARVAALLGKAEDSKSYAAQAAREADIFNARFYDAAARRYDKGSQTAQAMPLVLGIVPAGGRAAVMDALVADIRAHTNHVTAGDIGYHYVVDALLDGGRSDVLLDMLLRTDAPSYGNQLAQGVTALAEAWDAKPTASQDHFMLGHVEEWFYRGLAGIDLDLTREASRRLVLHPAVVGDLAWARASVNSAVGPIASRWQRSAAGTAYDFSIPVNLTATIELDAPSVQALTVNGVSAANSPGVLAAEMRNGKVSLVVGSGNYRVVADAHP